MKTKISYAMLYNEQIRDFILDKLTILFNKAMLDAHVRLLLRVPEMFDLQRVQRYREIFEEVSISRFAPESSSFWNMRNLYNFRDYCTSIDAGIDHLNLYIEQSVLVYDLPPNTNGPVIVSGKQTHDSIMTQYFSIIELLNNAGFKIETDDDFQCWDLSCCHFSNDVKKYLFFKLDEIIKKIGDGGRYITNIETHILISLLLNDIIKDLDGQIINLNLRHATLDNNLVEHMYTLI